LFATKNVIYNNHANHPHCPLHHVSYCLATVQPCQGAENMEHLDNLSKIFFMTKTCSKVFNVTVLCENVKHYNLAPKIIAVTKSWERAWAYTIDKAPAV